MSEEEDLMFEQEFKAMWESLSDDGKVEFYQKLLDSARENQKLLNHSDEYIRSLEEKLEKFKNAAALKKKIREVQHLLKTQLDLVNQRINARLLDQLEMESAAYFDDEKNNKSH